MKQIVWLASYPKSGNTWVRLFIEALLHEKSECLDINAIGVGSNCCSRALLDAYLGFDSINLTDLELDCLRPDVYMSIAANAKESVFFKTHDCYRILANGRPLFPPEVTIGVVYLVRNPLDVCVSFANHLGENDFRKTIDRMGNEEFAIANPINLRESQLRQIVSSWSTHVLGWIDQLQLKVHVVRYEDLISKPFEMFSHLALFLGIPFSEQKLAKAIGRTAFSELRKQEELYGFNERLRKSTRFFRAGEAGSWRVALTEQEVRALIARHKDMMARMGYLTESGEPVF